jgi:hypothetical protein
VRVGLGTLAAGGWQLAAQNLVTASDEVRVTIYDQAHLPHRVIQNAFDQLRLTLRRAGIALDAVVGDPAAEEASLFRYVTPPPHGKEQQAICGARRDIALKIVEASPTGLQETVLGMSSPFAPAGLNVRLFNDHIREAASRHNRPYAIVLSYAMAHEIGHVLLRSDSHAPWGIMKSVWTEYEYAQMSDAGLMSFTDHDAKAMLLNLRGMRCPTPDGGLGRAQRANHDLPGQRTGCAGRASRLCGRCLSRRQ